MCTWGGDYYKDLLLENIVFNSSVLIRTKLLRSIGNLDGNLIINSDYDLWVRIAQKYPILYFNRVTAKWRERKDSLSGPVELRSFNYKKWDLKLLEKHLKICPREYQALIKKRIREYYKTTTWGYFNLGNYEEVRALCFGSLHSNNFILKIWLYFFLSYTPLILIKSLKKIKIQILR